MKWLQSWYAQRCDGEWEHQHGIRIETLDNPGWAVHVDVGGHVQDRGPHRSETTDSWMQCSIRDGVFAGFGSPDMLEPMLSMLREWVEGPSSTASAGYARRL